MNPQIYSDRVDLTSETYFIQIPARSENLRILLWQREVVNIKDIEEWLFTNKNIARIANTVQHYSLLLGHWNCWLTVGWFVTTPPPPLLLVFQRFLFFLLLFCTLLCVLSLYLLFGIIFVFFVLLVSEIPIFLPSPSIGAQLFHHLSHITYNIANV